MTTDPEGSQQPGPNLDKGGSVPPPPPAAGYGQPGAVPPPAAGYGQPGAVPPPPAYGAPQGGGYPHPGSAPAGAPLSDSDQRLWAVLSHVGVIPFSFVPPLVIWLVFKGRGALAEDQAKEALNWSITVLIAIVAGLVLSGTGIGLLLGVPLLGAAGLASLVFGILAAVAASSGQFYRYPFTLRLIT